MKTQMWRRAVNRLFMFVVTVLPLMLGAVAICELGRCEIAREQNDE